MLRTDGGDGGMSAQGTGRVWCGQVCVHIIDTLILTQQYAAT
jgi:hypothetical protein